MKDILIGVDIGTSGTKAAVVDACGKVLGEALAEYPLICPQNGWAEQDPAEWEKAVCQSVREAVEKSGIASKKVAGICVSGLFAGSGVPLDEKGKPLRNAIIWMDRRAVNQCIQTNRLVGNEELFAVTGNRNDAYFGFNKILWIREEEPWIWEKLRWLLSSNGYVVYCLTGEMTMDDTSAANIGGIYDWEKNAWSDPMMKKFGIPGFLFPERLVKPWEIAGHLTREAAEKLGLEQGIPVCAGCTDCLASILSAGVLEENVNTAVIGTSINWGILHRKRPMDDRLVTMPYVVPDMLHYTYGGISSAGVLCKWFLENLAPYTERGDAVVRTDFRQMEREAADIAPGSEGLLVLPYFMGERSPVWDAKARGVWCGLSMKHTRAHLYRALLEALSYACRQIRQSSPMFEDAKDYCIVSGGAGNSRLWMQILADVTGLCIITTDSAIQAPVGDALIAGVATGVVSSFSEVKKWVGHSAYYRPDPARHEAYSSCYEKYCRLYDATAGIIHA